MVFFNNSELFVSVVVLVCDVFGRENTILVSLGTRLGSTDKDGGSIVAVMFEAFVEIG